MDEIDITSLNMYISINCESSVYKKIVFKDTRYINCLSFKILKRKNV